MATNRQPNTGMTWIKSHDHFSETSFTKPIISCKKSSNTFQKLTTIQSTCMFSSEFIIHPVVKENGAISNPPCHPKPAFDLLAFGGHYLLLCHLKQRSFAGKKSDEAAIVQKIMEDGNSGSSSRRCLRAKMSSNHFFQLFENLASVTINSANVIEPHTIFILRAARCFPVN